MLQYSSNASEVSKVDKLLGLIILVVYCVCGHTTFLICETCSYLGLGGHRDKLKTHCRTTLKQFKILKMNKSSCRPKNELKRYLLCLLGIET